MALWSRFFGSAGSQALGFSFGVASAPALLPAVQFLANEAWKLHPDKPPPATLLAVGVAEGKVDPASAAEWAAEQGYGDAQWSAMVAAARAGIPLGQAYSAWRRGEIGEDDFRRAIKRLGIADEWADALVGLKQDLLDPVQLANAIHRGLVADPGLLAVGPPAGQGKVPAYPVYPIDALDESAGHGIDRDRLGVLVGLMGLPMGSHEAAQAVFRKILTETDFQRAIAEGNTRNEWGDAIFEFARQIPTARDFIENALRGYRTLEQAQEGAALHGMSPEHARMIFQNSGRPLNLHQITQALAWGAKYNPLPGDDPDPYMNAVLIGAVTPAYYEMQDALKFNLPSAFFFRVLQQTGVVSETEAATWYKRMGWPPELAAQVAKAFAAGGGGGVDTHVGKAQTQLWNTLHRAYLAGEIDRATAADALPDAGVDAAAVPDVLDTWDREREIVRKQLTPAQLKKAFGEGVVNPDTGAAWTRDEVVAALIGRGYSPSDAATFLSI